MRQAKQVQKNVGELYTVQGAAEALGVSYWAVYRYLRLAGVPTTRLGNLVLVRLEDLREMVRAQTAPGGRSVAASFHAWERAGERLASDAGAAAVVGPDGRRAVERRYAEGVRGKRCPECGDNALFYEEGCQKCLSCGYAQC